MNQLNKPSILLVENIHPVAKEMLESNGYQVDLISHAPSEKELIDLIPKYSALGIRSKTEITSKVLEQASNLLTIGLLHWNKSD